MSVYKIKECLICHKEFLGHIAKKLCDVCDAARKATQPYKKVCRNDKCKKIFETTRKNQVFCSRVCKKDHHSAVYYRRKHET